jgi:hypothetical protein
VGGRFFAPTGPRLVIWDLTAEPKVIGQSEVFGGMVSSVAVKGDLAYVAEQSASGLDGKIHLLDLSDISTPKKLSEVSYGADGARNPTMLYIEGDTLFAADTEQGLLAFDLATPEAPALKAKSETYGVKRLVHDGQRLYSLATAFAGAYLTAWSFDGEKLEEAAGWSIPTVSPLDVAVLPGLVVVADVGGAHGFKAVDGEPLDQVFSNESVRARTAVRDGGRIYLPSEAGLFLVESGPGWLSATLANNDVLRRASASAASGGKLLVMTEDARAVVYDAGQTGVPTKSATADLPPVSPHGSAVANGLLYIPDFYTGLRILDAKTLASVGRLDALQDPSNPDLAVAVEDVAVEGNVAYMVDWFGVLIAVDVAKPAEPKILSVTSLEGGYPSAVAVEDQRVYVVESTNDSFLRIFDVNDPTKPTARGTLPVLHARDVAVRNKLVFVADQSSGDPTAGGLLIVDASDPDQPKLLAAHRDGCSDAAGLSLQGDTLAVSCGDSVHLLDISTPAKPTVMSKFTLPSGGAEGLLLRGDRLHVSAGTGLSTLDVKDPTKPASLGFLAAPRPARSVLDGGDGRLLMSASVGGIYAF